MPFTEEQVKRLAEPLSRANVKKNPRGYDYVEAWHAIAEANRIFGHDGWSRETIRLERCNSDLVELSGKNGPYQQWRVGYIATVRVTAGGIIREGTGYGSGMSKPEALGEAMEGAVKEAESDAMKRALMTFGNPFGLALYDKAQTNVVAEPPPEPRAVELASQLLRGCTTPAEFKEAWESNHEGWKGVLSESDYRKIQTVKVEMVSKLRPKVVDAA